MLSIKTLHLDQCHDIAKIFSMAYPGVKMTPEQYAERITKRLEDPSVQFYTIAKEEELIGGMRYHDFNMNLLQQQVKAGGIGSVAVALTHKKEKVAYHILQHFLKHYRDRGMSMTMLYPFHPGFYKRMGFGFGAPLQQFRLEPHQLPNKGDKSSVCFLNPSHSQLLLDYYTEKVATTNGLIHKKIDEFETLLNDANTHVMGYIQENTLKGYFVFQFEADPSSFLLNDMVINVCLYNSSEVFLAFCTFLNSQNDQIRHIIFNTQDPFMQFAFEDPRCSPNKLLTGVFHETNSQSVGIMYRVINVPKLFEELQAHNFGAQTLRLALHIKDSFLPENEGTYLLQIINGKASLEHSSNDWTAEVTITIDIADFSSLITGSTDFKTLHRYGCLQLSDNAYLKILQSVFSTDDPPICLTAF